MSVRIAFVFPGQGSQFVGMGADVLERSPALRHVLRRAGGRVGLDLVDVMLAGPRDRLDETVPTQVAVFALSVALAELAVQRGARPAAVAGHSLGEYSALVAGGWLDRDAATDAVVERARAMDRCTAAVPGAMAAVIGLRPDLLMRLLPAESGVVVANVNTPRQVVLSGPRDWITHLRHTVLAAGAAEYRVLPVAGAFHSPLMRTAEREYAAVVDQLPLRAGHTPLVSSVTGGFVDDPDAYRADLRRQITAPVRWADTAVLLAEHCPDGAVEVGPGQVLRGLLRRVDRGWPIVNCQAATALPDVSALFAERYVAASAARWG
ncbi:ACP S-malonyltransferase [Marinitenerispora sediminis]|uniref:Malonyl CoA-acyl carrier protein transacylase n=1 Tax=Marinitenerispora sediminis TaxID=1931232 RepID=A0A368T2U4_9ACTN|nr:ACP S-malonyltransferase [Marinitenerispora sediminis]RCV50084.1 hypothetical protein DEF23_22610 [Marinitenerispora sediminis]RCV55503.1 hypothetical protein DEF24_17870 [Marinitenerispora sediminis]RCV57613.1 hypothetical protein DEF28_01470 [Marinitenerispora sediminis]